MPKENGIWTLRGLSLEEPGCLRSPEELEAYVERVGFLPLFAGAVPGFSVEEHTAADHWWTGDHYDPWEWRKSLPAGRRLLYGKFFAGKAGYIARDWFPEFANWRRNGYDFDSLYEDELASHRSKKIMDLFRDREELLSPEVRQLAGFSSGEKNFEGAITALQMQTYLVSAGLRQRQNKAGRPYGWAVTVYTTPERLCGYDFVTSRYADEPLACRGRILEQLRALYGAGEAAALAALG